RLGVAAPRGVLRAEIERRRRAERVCGAARGHLREARATLQGLERLPGQLDPQRTLERGFSITRDAGGLLLRHPRQVGNGALLVSRLAGGLLRSLAQVAQVGEDAQTGQVTAATGLPARSPAVVGKRAAKPAAPSSQIAL